MPDLVTRLIAPPVVRPYSAEKALVRTFISWTAASGRLVVTVCRPQESSLELPSIVNVVWRRPPPSTTNSVSLRNRSPVPRAERTAEFSSGTVVSLLPSSGVSRIFCVSNRVPSCGASARTPSNVPLTRISSETPAGASVTSKLAVWLPASVKGPFCWVAKPSRVTVSVYAPVRGTSAIVYAPSDPERAVRVTPVVGLAIVIVAPAISAPEPSVTRPRTAAVAGVWAPAEAAKQVQTRASRRANPARAGRPVMGAVILRVLPSRRGGPRADAGTERK